MAENVYRNNDLGFSLEKPNSWEFLPAPWALNVIDRTSRSNPSLRELLEQAKKPFLFLQKVQFPYSAAIPSVKVSCLMIKRPGRAKQESLLNSQLEALSKFDAFELISSSTDCIASGCPSMQITSRYDLLNEVGTSYRCQSTLWTLFAREFAFAIGLSGSPDYLDEYQEDHAQILASISLSK